MNDPIWFGAFVPQGWKMELARIAEPQAKWARSVELALLAERLGYASLWLYDHFDNVPEPANETMLECWTTAAALSQLTSVVRLGQLVGCHTYRNPALLAKITSSLDVLSGGRLDWGVGVGGYQQEYTADRSPSPVASARIDMLEECVQIVQAMWSEPATTYNGRYYQVSDAHCDPKPVQRPRPQILVAGGAEEGALRVVARLADRSNFGGTPEQFKATCEILKSHCHDVGRDYDEIGKTIGGDVCIRMSESEVRAVVAQRISDQSYDAWSAANFVGTPDQVAEKVRAYVGLGCTGFLPWCVDYPDDTTLRLLATEVMPEFC